MKRILDLFNDESGMAVEYILIIAVVVAGVIAAAMYFLKPFEEGVTDMGDHLKTKIGTSHQ